MALPMEWTPAKEGLRGGERRVVSWEMFRGGEGESGVKRDG